MTTAEKAIKIINGCKNGDQTEVALKFIELLITDTSISIDDGKALFIEFDKKVDKLKKELK